jgi:hypothetical protein
MMKRILSIVTITAFLFSNALSAFAGPSGAVQVTVTISKTLSIAVTGGPIDFGSLGVGETAVSATAVSVTNDGSGADETVTLTVTDPVPGPNWTQGTPGNEVYRISFQAAATQPAAGDANWKLPADYSEVLSYDETDSVWIKLETPTVTAITAPQSMTVTFTAG